MASATFHRSARIRSAVALFLSALSASCGSDVTSDGCCEDLPGGDSPSLSDLFGNVLYRADGSQASPASLQAQSLIGIYFASRSCPACTSFTPQLVSAYDAMRRAGKPFEIVIACLDPSSEDLATYMRQYGMNWLGLPLGSDKIRELVKRYGVEWIPSLIVVNAAGKTVTRSGREDVAAKGAAAFDAWLAASPAP